MRCRLSTWRNTLAPAFLIGELGCNVRLSGCLSACTSAFSPDRSQAAANRFGEQAGALGFTDAGSCYALINNLMRADSVALDRIEATKDLHRTPTSASEAAAHADQARPTVLGDATDDLFCTPITPCLLMIRAARVQVARSPQRRRAPTRMQAGPRREAARACLRPLSQAPWRSTSQPCRRESALRPTGASCRCSRHR